MRHSSDFEKIRSDGLGGRRGAIALALCLTCSALIAPCRAELIPADRLTNWSAGLTVGVPGGIPTDRSTIIDVTKAPYNADNTGINDAQPAINAAIAAAPAESVVYLPAGTYRCNGGLTFSGWPYKSRVTLRGDGEQTIVRFYIGSGQAAILVGGGSDYAWDWPSTGNDITAGLEKGSTQIAIGDTSAFSIGQLVQIGTANDPSIPIVSVNGFDLGTNQPMRRQMTRITAKTSSTLSFFPGLYGDYSKSSAKVRAARMQADRVGIEDILIDASNSGATFTIWLEQCYASWVKNVRIYKSPNYHVFIQDSVNCELRHCYLDQLNHTGNNGAGLLCNTISGCLIEDNIIYDAQPLIEVNFGSCGNVFAYNYCDVSPGTGIDTNHGPHNSYNLYEGNVVQSFQADGYYGSVSHDTIFRNWITSVTPAKSPSYSIGLQRFTRLYSVVGNLLQHPAYTYANDGISCGNPNMGNSSYSGTAQPSKGVWWKDWTRTLNQGVMSQSGNTIASTTDSFVASDYTGPYFRPALLWINGSTANAITGYIDAKHITVDTAASRNNASFVIWAGAAGFQELDLDVAATLIRKANHYISSNGVPANEALGSETLPTSLYRASKPAWFGDLTWPAFDPASPNRRIDAIPAGYRFLNGGKEAPGVTSTVASAPPTSVRIIRN